MRSKPKTGAGCNEILLWIGLLLALSIIGTGCFSSETGPRTPEATVRAFAVALGEKDYKRAYRLMSSSYRRRVSLEQFKRQLEQNPDETLRTSLALTRVTGPAEQKASLTYGDGEELRLVYAKGTWRIATNVVDFYDQSTPRAALRTFVRAMERRRYDVVMRLVPNADKEGITTDRMDQAWSGEGREEVERMLANLRENLDNPIERIGQHATMPYGDRLRVQFIREDGVWKIEDPE